MAQEKTNVYVPLGAGVYPGHTQHEVLGSQQGKHVGITSAVIRPNIPGVSLHQTTQLNGVLIDTSTPGIVR